MSLSERSFESVKEKVPSEDSYIAKNKKKMA